jgi:hypothetical protein
MTSLSGWARPSTTRCQDLRTEPGRAGATRGSRTYPFVALRCGRVPPVPGSERFPGTGRNPEPGTEVRLRDCFRALI